MRFIITMVLACVFVAVAARSIKAVPWLWYGLAAVLDIVYAYGIVFNLPSVVLQALSLVVQRGTFATALFVIVMYCGVFPESSAIRKVVGGIRAELSVIACILALAHSLNYLDSYIGALSGNIGVFEANQLASLLIAIVLLVLLIILGVTSIKAVKHRMRASIWKNIQKSSYPFFALIYIHQLLILYPSAAKGMEDSVLTCITSGIVFAAYFVLRFIKYLDDRKKRDMKISMDLEMERGDGAYSSQA